MIHIEDTEHAEAAVARFRSRVMPILFAVYVLNFFDRTNISYAQLKMGANLGISLSVYGLGAGLFFIGYASACIPSNLALKRFGPTRWMAFIIVVWGSISCLMSIVQGERSFYALRFLLGIVEGGFVPAVNFYIASWIPRRFRSRINSLFIMAIPVGLIVGGPLAGLLIGFNGLLSGWRWLFIIEGLATVLAGLVVFRSLPNSPDKAAWLNDRQRSALEEMMRTENATADASTPSGGVPGFAAFKRPIVWGLLTIMVIVYATAFAVIYFIPTILRDLYHITPVQIGASASVPYVAALAVAYLMGRSSERFGEIRWHLFVVCAMGCAGLFLLDVAAGISIAAFLAALSLVNSFTVAFYGPLNTAIQNQIGASAAPLALVTSIGSLGGFLGPTLTGFAMRLAGGNWRGAALCFAFAALFSGVLAILCVPGVSRKTSKTALPAAEHALK